ncbi:hypothetical protein Q5H91_04645 [Sphingomonas sp. KR1UV-12]|uniref:Uncharacterized protein n=1 Tax=Sphingomonas aurea TaxID=3063994 RepID=A0ABT9EI88_9SPHN|nr:hypothetical protein [Sphingomonas sp. KR1UV-12]MDP1026491.1 hypothetical protein [Sphingomonas sp. KR1UV-12]
MKILPALALLPLLIAGCSRDRTAYPSLAKRPVEAMNFADPPAPPEQAVVADPALDARIATWRTRLAAVASGFDEAAAKTERMAKAAGARTVGSDAWLDVQTALAGLDDWRAQATAIAADAEAAGSARAAMLTPPYPSLEALEQTASAEVDRQGAALDRVQALLPAA